MFNIAKKIAIAVTLVTIYSGKFHAFGTDFNIEGAIDNYKKQLTQIFAPQEPSSQDIIKARRDALLEASKYTHPFILQLVCKKWRFALCNTEGFTVIRGYEDLNPFMQQCMYNWLVGEGRQTNLGRLYYPVLGLLDNAVLCYTKDDGEKFDLNFSDLKNPLLCGTLDLSGCGETARYLRITTSVEKFFRVEKEDIVDNPKKTIILITTPLSGKAILSFNKNLKSVISQWNMEKAPVGLFWRYGYDRYDWTRVDYLTSPLELISSRDLYKNWKDANSLTKSILREGIRHEESKTFSLFFGDTEDPVLELFYNAVLRYTLEDGGKLLDLDFFDPNDPLRSTFDLSKCGKEAATCLRITTSVEKFFTVEDTDTNKTIILITTPHSGKKIFSFNRYLALAIHQWNMGEAPVGLFWRYGYDTSCVDYLTSPLELISSRDLDKNWQKAKNCLRPTSIRGTQAAIEACERLHLSFPNPIDKVNDSNKQYTQIVVSSSVPQRSIINDDPSTKLLKELFGKAVLRYTKDSKSIHLYFSNLKDPLCGTFDLSRCGEETAKCLRITTSVEEFFKDVKSWEKAPSETVILITPQFNREIITSFENEFASVMHTWDIAKAPVGLFWRNEKYDRNIYGFYYLISSSLTEISSQNLYENWLRSKRFPSKKPAPIVMNANKSLSLIFGE